MKRGDIVLEAGGQRVPDVNALRFRFATGVLGETMPLSVRRGGETLEVGILLSPAPLEPKPDERVLQGSHPLAGAKIVNLSPALAEELEIPNRWSGVLVMGVYRGSPAARLGLRFGDFILKVDGQDIDSTTALEQYMDRSTAPWSLVLEREGRQLTWSGG